MLCQLNNRGLDVEFAHVLLSLFVFFVQIIFSLKMMEEEKEVVRTAPITNCEMELCVNVILKPRTSSHDV